MGLIKSLRLVPFLGILGGIVMFAVFESCHVSYSFTGASISPDIKTFTVDYFPNRAPIVYPNLSQSLQESLQEKLTRQTSMDYVQANGDLQFSGQITGYSTRPMNVQEGDYAAQTRLTVTVKVKFVNNKNHDADWEKSFSAYQDFDSTKQLADVEDDLVTEIVDELSDDIFNASIANW